MTPHQREQLESYAKNGDAGGPLDASIAAAALTEIERLTALVAQLEERIEAMEDAAWEQSELE